MIGRDWIAQSGSFAIVSIHSREKKGGGIFRLIPPEKWLSFDSAVPTTNSNGLIGIQRSVSSQESSGNFGPLLDGNSLESFRNLIGSFSQDDGVRTNIE